MFEIFNFPPSSHVLGVNIPDDFQSPSHQQSPFQKDTSTYSVMISPGDDNPAPPPPR